MRRRSVTSVVYYRVPQCILRHIKGIMYQYLFSDSTQTRKKASSHDFLELKHHWQSLDLGPSTTGPWGEAANEHSSFDSFLWKKLFSAILAQWIWWNLSSVKNLRFATNLTLAFISFLFSLLVQSSCPTLWASLYLFGVWYEVLHIIT